jgi:hypothetical protein
MVCAARTRACQLGRDLSKFNSSVEVSPAGISYSINSASSALPALRSASNLSECLPDRTLQSSYKPAVRTMPACGYALYEGQLQGSKGHRRNAQVDRLRRKASWKATIKVRSGGWLPRWSSACSFGCPCAAAVRPRWHRVGSPTSAEWTIRPGGWPNGPAGPCRRTRPAASRPGRCAAGLPTRRSGPVRQNPAWPGCGPRGGRWSGGSGTAAGRSRVGQAFGHQCGHLQLARRQLADRRVAAHTVSSSRAVRPWFRQHASGRDWWSRHPAGPFGVGSCEPIMSAPSGLQRRRASRRPPFPGAA